MTRARQPYNPALAEYQSKQAMLEDARRRDRKAREINRGISHHVAPVEITDPDAQDSREKIIVMRSTRNDPLGGMHARRFIDEAQYQGGRAYQHDFETAERGPRAIDPSKEAVDGGRMPEPLTDRQIDAVARLARADRDLGLDGSSIVHEVLILGLSVSQLAASRGLVGEHFRKYFGRRLNECLDRLAMVYGFSTR
jgi:hypothetical protein